MKNTPDYYKMLSPNLVQSITSKHKNIGIGSGKTISSLLQDLSPNSTYIPSSFLTHENLNKHNLNVKMLNQIENIDIYLDGADYYDKNKNFIKGKGGCLTQERYMMDISNTNYIFVQKYKYVDSFEKLLVPLDVMPFAHSYAKSVGAVLKYCTNRFGPTITENGCFLMEIPFEKLKNVHNVTGIISHGYFEFNADKHRIIEL